MKSYFKRYSYSYVVISLILIVLSLGIKRRLNIEVPFIRVCIANIYITLFISLAWSIFKMKKWNGMLKIILAFISLVPIIFLLKRAFGPLLFRASITIYLFALIVSITYSLAVIVVSTKAKKDAKYLNSLLNVEE